MYRPCSCSAKQPRRAVATIRVVQFLRRTSRACGDIKVQVVLQFEVFCTERGAALSDEECISRRSCPSLPLRDCGADNLTHGLISTQSRICTHVSGATHSPRFAHSGRAGVWQSAPDQPGLQAHTSGPTQTDRSTVEHNTPAAGTEVSVSIFVGYGDEGDTLSALASVVPSARCPRKAGKFNYRRAKVQ